MLNAHLSPNGNYDLIHCAHCLSKNKDKPWITDFEAYWQLWASTKQTKKGIEKARKVLRSKNCKKILPWTEKIKKELLSFFPELKDKIELVYPAIPLKKSKKISKKDVTLIFSSRYFYWKGGLHALEAIDRLTKKYSNVRAIMNSQVPEEMKQKYSKNKKIEFYGLIPQKKLFELYEKADVLIYPGYTDSFGFAYLEAMSFGIPTITVDGWSRKELISEGKTGFVLERPRKFKWDKIGIEEEKIVEKIVEKASLLIENKKLREKVSKNCIKEIKQGRFSIKERNKKLKKIYEGALK